MDNNRDSPTSTNYDAIGLRDRTIPTEVNPCYELRKNVTKGVKTKGTKEAPKNTNLNTVLITMMVILLLLTLTSIALSVTIFNRLSSEAPKLAHQLDKIEDTRIELKLTQLIQMQNSTSQIFAQLGDQLSDFIAAQINDTRGHPQSECGPGLWWRVAYLDMTDPSQQCPSAWREYNTSGVKACGRPANSTGSCATEFYCTNHQYSRVCGRIIGYQVGAPDAFTNNFRGLDGVIISHGVQQEHIWSYAAGLTENGTRYRAYNCPCSTVAGSTQPPTHIGEQHYCESGNPTNTFEVGQLYSSDPLWDGQQCEGTCCTGIKSPPWFSVQLPAPTTDIIEVSICCDQGTMDEDTPIKLIEIYVQ